MIDKIVRMIIEEAQSKQDMDISLSLMNVTTTVSLLILRLSTQISQIQAMKIADEEKELFIQHLLQTPY